MSCCGQNRFAGAARPAVQSWPAPASFARLEYTGDTAILVRGPSSGRHYQFSALRRAADVHPADADILLQTGYFRRAP